MDQSNEVSGAGEMRQNMLTNRWVIVAPDRGRRPYDFGRPATETVNLPEREAGCPFCPGNERMLPAVLFELPAGDGRSWQTRVVPNKFPVLTPNGGSVSPVRGPHRAAPNYGHHNVIIETPVHNRDLPVMSRAEVERVIDTYVRRYAELCDADERIESIVIFRNHGEKAGTSLRHPHSQVIATGALPEFTAHRERIARDHFERYHRCPLCYLTEFERSDGTRMVVENESFSAFVPFAAEAPYEVWIVPRRHRPDFGQISGQEQEDLAPILQDVLRRYDEQLNDPDYNYIFHSHFRPDTDAPHLHWYVQVRPRLTTPAGFEIGSEMQINVSVPENDAEVLRSAHSVGEAVDKSSGARNA